MTHASLPMYDRPETAKANDRLWHLIRENLGYGPKTLTRGADLWQAWQSPDLLLSQTCGYPYRARLHGHVTLIGTPDYGVKDCPQGYYNSVFIARKSDKRNALSDFQSATFAYSDALSQSGWAAPATYMSEQGLTFAKTLRSGGHMASAKMVVDGSADFAAIDAVTWSMISRYDSFAKDLQIIDQTTPTPGLPLISALDTGKTALFSALETAIKALPDTDKTSLSLKGIIAIPAEKYLAVPNPDNPPV